MVKKKKTSIKDIARECGVGLGTVSRVINSKPGVKDEVRRKVMQYIEDIGWRCNNLHTRFKIDQTERTIVFIASTSILERKYDQDLFRMILERAIADGFTPLTLFGQCRENLERCSSMKLYGVVVIGVSSFQKEAVEKLLELGIRVVGIGECYEFAGPLVCPAHRHTAKQAVKQLKKAGHEHIGFFGGMGILNKIEKLEDISIRRIREMLHGIIEEVPSFDIGSNVVSDCFSDLSLLRKKLKNGHHTAWLCSDEKMCRQFIYCANELGKKIPDDMSMISFTRELPFYSFSPDVTRYYPDNSSQVTQVMELLHSNPVTQPKILFSNCLLHEGNSVRENYNVPIATGSNP